MPRPMRVVTDKKIDMKSLKRLMAYVFKKYGKSLIAVAICIIISSVSTVIVNMFMAKLIDGVIVPGLSTGFDAVKAKLVHIIELMILFDVLGIVAAIIYPRIMATVGQGTIKSLRDDMFDNMETLPIMAK